MSLIDTIIRQCRAHSLPVRYNVLLSTYILITAKNQVLINSNMDGGSLYYFSRPNYLIMIRPKLWNNHSILICLMKFWTCIPSPNYFLPLGLVSRNVSWAFRLPSISLNSKSFFYYSPETGFQRANTTLNIPWHAYSLVRRKRSVGVSKANF